MNKTITASIFSILVLALLLFGCTQTENQNATPTSSASIQASIQPTTQGGDGTMTAQNGDTVSVDYVGTLDNGTVFDTSIKAEAQKAGLPLRPSYSPLEFTVGAGQMIAGFDKGVVGMKEGETKTVHLTPSEAYGEKRADAIISVPIANVPNGTKVGSQLSASNGAPGVVIEVNATHVKIDFNHELAGKALNFKIIMRKITKK
jgi:FKBP-type peptidyl-prolyl cis-trans isomerase 2